MNSSHCLLTFLVAAWKSDVSLSVAHFKVTCVFPSGFKKCISLSLVFRNFTLLCLCDIFFVFILLEDYGSFSICGLLDFTGFGTFLCSICSNSPSPLLLQLRSYNVGPFYLVTCIWYPLFCAFHPFFSSWLSLNTFFLLSSRWVVLSSF